MFYFEKNFNYYKKTVICLVSLLVRLRCKRKRSTGAFETHCLLLSHQFPQNLLSRD